jgi:23S rRNA (cytidine1920-2'-O)/16S rRNA (cytidine1409-2'-O)-methyltransferase
VDAGSFLGGTQVGSGGIVRDDRIHQQVVQSVTAGIVAHGFEAHGVMESPLKGAAAGNKEFLGYFRRLAAAPSGRVPANSGAIEGEATTVTLDAGGALRRPAVCS